MSRDAVPILVTGGAGYVGAQTCKLLAASGFLPVCYDNLTTGHREAVRWGPLEEGDLLKPARLDEVLARHRPAAVLHFAACALVGESMTDPGKYYRNNGGGSLNLLDALRRHDVGWIVFSSTCAVYGPAERVPIPEDHPLGPASPYGASKAMVERMLADFESAHGLRSASLRYFNAAGADPEGEIGEDHDPETHLIPIILDAALGRRSEVAIFGADYPTPDGTCIRDYVHVGDLAEAHLRALKHLLGGGPSLRLNLGSGRGHSVREVIAAAERISGRKIAFKAEPRRPGDPPRLVADAALARRILGWSAERSSLETILADAWAWHRKRHGVRRDGTGAD